MQTRPYHHIHYSRGKYYSEHELAQLTPDDRFYYYMEQIEGLKAAYAQEYTDLSNGKPTIYPTPNSKAEKIEKLAQLRIDGMEEMQRLLMTAARIFGYNPRFDVRTENEKIWYRARNPSAERMLHRVEMVYMHQELQRG